MEPVTHVLAGACVARAGFNRRAAYATAAMAVAAEFPDIDTLWALRGPVAAFQHHRGITHTFLGLPFEAAFLLLIFWLFHRWRHPSQSSARAQGKRASVSAAPVRWGTLYGLLLVALLSHLLLDYTNNYGVRPLFPFNTHWYAASIVFIFDPLIFILLLAGLLLPSLFGLIGQEVGAKREHFRGSGWARASLVCVVGLWLLRAYEHSSALMLANLQTLQSPAVATSSDQETASTAGTKQEDGDTAPQPQRPLLTPLRSIASPDPLSIFRWYTATDFGPAYRLGTADTRTGALTTGEILAKPSPGPALSAAEQSRLGRVYLDWSALPWIVLDNTGTEGQGGATATATFQDLRFMGTPPILHRSGAVPLSGVVVLDRSGKVLEEGMDGRFERE